LNGHFHAIPATMPRIFMTRAKYWLPSAMAFLALTAFARADDGAASIAAGGLLARRETRIVMAKEVPRISEKNIAAGFWPCAPAHFAIAALRRR